MRRISIGGLLPGTMSFSECFALPRIVAAGINSARQETRFAHAHLVLATPTIADWSHILELYALQMEFWHHRRGAGIAGASSSRSSPPSRGARPARPCGGLARA